MATRATRWPLLLLLLLSVVMVTVVVVTRCVGWRWQTQSTTTMTACCCACVLKTHNNNSMLQSTVKKVCMYVWCLSVVVYANTPPSPCTDSFFPRGNHASTDFNSAYNWTAVPHRPHYRTLIGRSRRRLALQRCSCYMHICIFFVIYACLFTRNYLLSLTVTSCWIIRNYLCTLIIRDTYHFERVL